MLSESVDRGKVGLLLSPFSTLKQSGVFGYGLGTATQGAYHLTGQYTSWQEDGGGKLFVELGVPGVLLLAAAGWLVLREMYAALQRCTPESQEFRLKAGLAAVLAGNAASFLISHQAYSGDPTSICLVLFCLGAFFGVATQPVHRKAGRRKPHPVSWRNRLKRGRPLRRGDSSPGKAS
jgi:hypothetical protein